MTGDKIGLAPRIIGGALWGRIGGFVSGVINALVDWFSGKDIGDHIFSALFGELNQSGGGTAIAQSVKPVSGKQSAIAQIGSKPTVETATWTNPFAYEDRFASLPAI
jgi:hypothetical protein